MLDSAERSPYSLLAMTTATKPALTALGSNVLRSAARCIVNGQPRLYVNLSSERSLKVHGLAGMICRGQDSLSLQQFQLLTPAGEAARLALIEGRAA
jgi:hypothetical protein